jgi:hypothetical protein
MSKKTCVIIVVIVAAVAVGLSLLFSTMLANRPPVIAGLEPCSERVLPRGTCEIVCNATDPEGDELIYGWSASGGTITGEGATVTWTAPASRGSYNVTVVVTDGRGGGATDYVTIEVRPNTAPTIESLVADAAWTLPSGSIQLTCDASDPDNDELSYEWTATGGVISGTGAAVNWTAPQEVGVYYITVVVRDRHGASDTRTLPVSVVTGEPPTIEALVVTADHCYLKDYSWGYKVGKGKDYHMECRVADAGTDLSYEWACTGGGIAGEGPAVTWTAPNPSGSVDVTVTVIVFRYCW